MSIYQYYSPRSPLPEDRGMSGLELNLEQKIRMLESAERSYDGAVTAYALQQQNADMGDNRRSSIRRKRKITCTGCTKNGAMNAALLQPTKDYGKLEIWSKKSNQTSNQSKIEWFPNKLLAK